MNKYCALKEDYYLGRGYKEKNVSDESYYLLSPWNSLFYCFQLLPFSDNSPKIHFYVDFNFCWGKSLYYVAYKVDVGSDISWNAPIIHLHLILRFRFYMVVFVNLGFKKILDKLLYLNIKSGLLFASWLTMFYIFW